MDGSRRGVDAGMNGRRILHQRIARNSKDSYVQLGTAMPVQRAKRVEESPVERTNRRAWWTMVRIASAAGVLTVGLASPAHASTVFTAGDVVVYRVGTGAAALSGTSTAVTLDEYLPSSANQATAQFSLAMPIAAGTGTTPNPLTASGSASSEGGLSLSTDGTTLLIPGYAAATGVSSIASTTDSVAQRVVGEVDSAGDINTTTTFGATAFSGNNPRGPASVDGSVVWMAGAGGTEATSGGVWSATKGATTSTMLTGGNFRWARIFNGQLYASSASATSPAVIGINQVGTGLPTTTSTITNLAGLDSSSTGSPYDYYLLSEGGTGIDTAYVADNTIGIEKYSLIAGTWTAEGSIAMAGVTGLTGSASGTTVTLYATDPTSLATVTDAFGTGTLAGSPTTLATAATNEAFRGVALAPQPAVTTQVPEAPLAILLPIGALLLIGGAVIVVRRRRQAA